jgi:NTP pyrophosphatase (non-canonical NTP hydrolase)
MTYYVYHIPGVKVGCTTNLQKRVTNQQGYNSDEYEVLLETKDINEASIQEQVSQLEFGYKKDLKLYKNLFKKQRMKKHSSSPATTTFKIPKSELNAKFLADLKIKNTYGEFKLDTTDKIDWVISNAVSSQFGPSTCYIYNKAMAKAGPFQKHDFDKIRNWAEEKGILDKGDLKTQLIKLYEEAGELSQSILKDNREDTIDAIGDCVVVLTNLAELAGVRIEDCISTAYDEISNRTGKMINGTFVKDEG